MKLLWLAIAVALPLGCENSTLTPAGPNTPDPMTEMTDPLPEVPDPMPDPLQVVPDPQKMFPDPTQRPPEPAACIGPGRATVVSVEDGDASGPSVVAQGGSLMVSMLTQDASTKMNVDLVRVDAAMQVVDRQRSIATGASLAHRPRMVWAKDHLELGYSDIRNLNNEIYLLSVSPAGTVQSEVRFTNNDLLSFPGTVAYADDVNELAVVWSEGDGQTRQMKLARAGLDGAAIGNTIAVGAPGGSAEYSRAVWTGHRWLVSWYELRDNVLGTHYNAVALDGTSLGPQPLSPNAQNASWTDVAWNGTEGAIVWQEINNDIGRVMLQRVDADGALIGAATPISGGAGGQPSVVWARDRWQVAFLAPDSGVDQVFMVAIGRDGAVLEGRHQVTCTGVRAIEATLTYAAGHLYLAHTELAMPYARVLLNRL